jgi:hypothetical protein
MDYRYAQMGNILFVIYLELERQFTKYMTEYYLSFIQLCIPTLKTAAN